MSTVVLENIDSPVAKTIQLKVGGSQFGMVDLDGNLKLGAGAPAAKLDITGSALITGTSTIAGTTLSSTSISGTASLTMTGTGTTGSGFIIKGNNTAPGNSVVLGEAIFSATSTYAQGDNLRAFSARQGGTEKAWISTDGKAYLLGNITVGSINKLSITQPANGSTLAIADGKTFTASNSLTFVGTDSTTMTFPAVSGTVVTTTLQANITGGNYNVTGVGTFSATADSSFDSTGALKIPVGTAAQRPTGAKGKVRFNDDTSMYEGYDGTTWSALGGAQAAGVIYENATTIAANYTLSSGKNGFSVGPIQVNSGVAVTVPTGKRWVIF